MTRTQLLETGLVCLLACACELDEGGGPALENDLDGGEDASQGDDTSEGDWIQTALCLEGDDDAVEIVGIAGAPSATTSFVIEGAYQKATDIMANPDVVHDFLHATWAANTGWTNDGGRCYPVRLIHDDAHGTIRVDGYECGAFAQLQFDVDEIHCPPEF